MSTWYYARSGQRFGPFSFEQLRQMAISGMLTRNDMVMNEIDSSWKSAHDVLGLFGQSSETVSTAPAATPNQKPESQQATTPLAETSEAFSSVPAETPNQKPGSFQVTRPLANASNAVASATPATPNEKVKAPKPSPRSTAGNYSLLWGALALIGAAALLRYAGCLPEDSTIGDRNAPKRLAKEISEANAIQISADDLSKERRSNDIVVNQKYKDKVLEVSGIINSVRPASSAGRPYLQLGGVRCEFKVDSDIQHLNAGQFVTVRGKYQGSGVLMYCILR